MARHLVVCCDGTWNRADQSYKTNVAKVALAVRRRTALGTEQRVYYHSGVGAQRPERLRGGAFGLGLSRNVLDAYHFLVQTYEPGDHLYLFGFSRGAFTARSLAGLVRNCGILRREQADRTAEAWALYRSRTKQPTSVAATLFRQAYARETEIRFVGVWDTVGSLGIPVPAPWFLRPLVDRFNKRWAFHDTTLSSWVNGAFHALAVDEQRSAFPPTLWHQQKGAAEQGQELRQVWFAGVHTDVGGGEADSSLSDLPLLWMVGHAARYGLEFDPGVLSKTKPEQLESPTDYLVLPNPLGERHYSRVKFYKVFRVMDRPIGQAVEPPDLKEPGAPDVDVLDGCEALSDSVVERYKTPDKPAEHDYRPPKLDEYFRIYGDARRIEHAPLRVDEPAPLRAPVPPVEPCPVCDGPLTSGGMLLVHREDDDTRACRTLWRCAEGHHWWRWADRPGKPLEECPYPTLFRDVSQGVFQG
ncbi:DUF2235 domain-containing protein [Streptomyces griseorubiginosus]|uniref:DUF2235 domain-containing protein n=1 Tax=Streptomyces griseorubiginosus TaxID=67304 RepID=UPI0036515C0E